MTPFPQARRATMAASVALLALTALVGCERRQSDVPAPTPSSPTTPSTTGTGTTDSGATGTSGMGTTTPGSADSSASGAGMGNTTPMPGSAASDPMAPASAASR